MPRNKFPEETKQRILDAAFEVFVEKGYEATTILDIVAATDGLTRGAFYHHFNSKEEVLDEIAERIFYENNPFEAVRNEEGLTGLEKLQKVLFINVAELQELDEARQQLAAETANLLKSPHFLSSQFKFNRMLTTRYLQPLIEEGMADGSIKQSNAKFLAELMMFTINIWTNSTLYPVTPKEFVAKLEFVNELFDGIGFPIFDGDEALAAGMQLAEMAFPEEDIEKLAEKIDKKVEESA